MLENKLAVSIFGKSHEIDIARLFENEIPKSIIEVLLLYTEAIYQQKQLEIEFKVKRSEFYSRQLRRDSKLPEWKLKLRYNQSDEYKEYTEGLARTQRTIDRLIAIVEGLKKA